MDPNSNISKDKNKVIKNDESNSVLRNIKNNNVLKKYLIIS